MYMSWVALKFELQVIHNTLDFSLKFYAKISIFILSNHSQYEFWILNIIVPKFNEIDFKN